MACSLVLCHGTHTHRFSLKLSILNVVFLRISDTKTMDAIVRNALFKLTTLVKFTQKYNYTVPLSPNLLSSLTCHDVNF